MAEAFKPLLPTLDDSERVAAAAAFTTVVAEGHVQGTALAEWALPAVIDSFSAASASDEARPRLCFAQVPKCMVGRRTARG